MTNGEIKEQNIQHAYTELQFVIDDLRASHVHPDAIKKRVAEMLGEKE